MTIFFVVSCAVQALSGFVVDRFGPRPVLFAGLSLLGVAAIWLFDQNQLLDDGRVYGVVYAGLDIGQAIAPLIFGTLMDHQQYRAVWPGLGLVMVLVVLIASAFKVRRVRRTALAPAA